MAVQWTEDLATGIERIDAQHQALYAEVAALHDAMRSNRLDLVPGVLDGLERYAREHFLTEEQVMVEHAFPRLAQHRVLHRAFVDELGRHRAQLAGRTTLSGVVGLSIWLGDWLREHLRKEDGLLAEYLRARR